MAYSLREKNKEICDRLLCWMEKEGFRGWDPHDALNSPFLKGLSKVHPWAGITGLQLVKRCPINLRPLLRVPKTINPKGMGLVLAASIRRYKVWRQKGDLERAAWICEWLEANISPGYSGACWGYPFDWPNRSFYAPYGTPNIVNTAFIGHALLDFYDITGDKKWLKVAESIGSFICNDLNRTQGKGGFCFSYTPFDLSRVHNANLLGASLLARVGRITWNPGLIKMALNSAGFSLKSQAPDGSWPYGEAPNQAWVDSFHTGYNLMALKQIWEASHDPSVKHALYQGYGYYLSHFFLRDGIVRYFDNRTEPLDAHAFAHALICLTEMCMHPDTPLDLASRVLEKMIRTFWSGQGYFYWQRRNGLTYRMPCMRWVQAWVLLALSNYALWFDMSPSFAPGHAYDNDKRYGERIKWEESGSLIS